MGFKELIFLVLVATSVSSCYSFKGTTISPDVKTFFIGNFRNNAPNAPAEIGQLFSDRLREKVLRESRLAYSEVDPSVEFEGSVTSFSVSSVAPSSEGGQIGSSLNRLSISVNVEYINYINEDASFTQSFSFFQDFESTENLFDVQESLTEEIFNQITEDVFNKTFSDW